MKQKMTAMTIAMAVLVVAATLLTGHLQPRPFDIGDYSQIDIADAETAFAQTQSNDDLILLCKALSWRVEVTEEEKYRDSLRQYGQELLERAKAETVDLETVDDPDVMLAVLRIIRECGAK